MRGRLSAGVLRERISAHKIYRIIYYDVNLEDEAGGSEQEA